MKNTVLIGAIASFAGSASGGGLVIAEFDLMDHPNGNQNPPPYGLRVDNIVGGGVATLSIDFFGDTTLQVIDDGGDLSIEISGTLYGGTVSNGMYDSPNAYSIFMSYSVGVADNGNGWVVNGHDSDNMGILTNLDTLDSYDLFTTTDQGQSFRFLSDGHRLNGDNSSWVGRGWITDQMDGSNNLGGNQDWLFTATEVPAPSGMAILGLVGLVGARRRR